MEKHLKKIDERLAALNPREKAMTVILMTGAVVLFHERVLVPPLALQMKQVAQQEEGVKKSLDELLAKEQEIMASHNQEDPNAANRTELKTLEAKLALLDKRLTDFTVNFIAPKQMTAALQSILVQDSGLILREVRSMPPTPLLEDEQKPEEKGTTPAKDAKAAPPAKDAKAAPPKETKAVEPVKKNTRLPSNIYQHPVVISFQGNFMDTMAYLKKVESLQWRVYWDSLVFEVEDYPNARVTITLFTYSRSEAWIGA